MRDGTRRGSAERASSGRATGARELGGRGAGRKAEGGLGEGGGRLEALENARSDGVNRRSKGLGERDSVRSRGGMSGGLGLDGSMDLGGSPA